MSIQQRNYPNMGFTERGERACEDIVAVETIAPGLKQVTTWSDTYVLDARGDGCNCPDKQYNDDVEFCKHELGAILADVETLPTPFITEDLE